MTLADPGVTDIRTRTVLRSSSRWVRISLLAILIAAALLYTWNIGFSGLSPYYAASAKSMASNSHAFVFGALDPAATTTLDKLSGFLLPQVLAIKLFGVHAWALSLPQAIEGVITVFVGFLIGTRWRGEVYGVAMAGMLAVTPMLAAMFGRPMEDGMLTMCQVLAFAALQRSLLSSRLAWLLASGAWVAVGFQAKMLQSWLFLPALVIAYLVGSRVVPWKRLAHAALACAVAVVLSVSWMTAIQLVPASSRPYIDGTTNNNVFSMVFGYNGVDRLIPGLIPGAVAQLNVAPASGASPPSISPATAYARVSWAKLLLPQFSTQIGWLYPLATAGVAAAVLGRRRRPEELAFAVALAVPAAVLSFAFVPHATYFAVLALPLVALAAHGAVSAVGQYRHGTGRRWMILPAVIVAQTAWTVTIMLTASPKLRDLAVVAAVGGASGLAFLVAARLGVLRGVRWQRIGMIAAATAALIGPVSWSLCVLGPGGGGSASDAFAGPRLGPVTTSTAETLRRSPGGVPFRPPFTAPADAPLSDADARLLAYVDARNPPHAIAFATDSIPIATSVILTTGANPMPMGGFSRQAPSPTLRKLRGLVRSGRLRFVLLDASDSAAVAPPNRTMAADRAWVRGSCRAVMEGRFSDKSVHHQTLWDCGA